MPGSDIKASTCWPEGRCAEYHQPSGTDSISVVASGGPHGAHPVRLIKRSYRRTGTLSRRASPRALPVASTMNRADSLRQPSRSRHASCHRPAFRATSVCLAPRFIPKLRMNAPPAVWDSHPTES